MMWRTFRLFKTFNAALIYNKTSRSAVDPIAFCGKVEGVPKKPSGSLRKSASERRRDQETVGAFGMGLFPYHPAQQGEVKIPPLRNGLFPVHRKGEQHVAG